MSLERNRQLNFSYEYSTCRNIYKDCNLSLSIGGPGVKSGSFLSSNLQGLVAHEFSNVS